MVVALDILGEQAAVEEEVLMEEAPVEEAVMVEIAASLFVAPMHKMEKEEELLMVDPNILVTEALVVGDVATMGASKVMVQMLEFMEAREAVVVEKTEDTIP